MKKRYAETKIYEKKLEKVMARLGADSYSYDWSRYDCWVEFAYKGQRYRFSHSLENAEKHGINIRFVSDLFAQVVLTLEDISRMIERGIYDLNSGVIGMECLPAPTTLDACFQALNFKEMPTAEEVKKRYKDLCKMLHPDNGGDGEVFNQLNKNYMKCIRIIEKEPE